MPQNLLDQLTDAMIDVIKTDLLQAADVIETISARELPGPLASCLSKTLAEVEKAYATLQEEFPDPEEDEGDDDEDEDAEDDDDGE